MNERRFRFDFTHLRFVITAVLFLAAGGTSIVFTSLIELLNDRHLRMGIVVGAILFALVFIHF